ncbi:MAG: FkbM family methyltransferase [Lachnospiraceae bacterium]|nr:FkbM family methyltransferase [Lachnospiraceae bacterium]
MTKYIVWGTGLRAMNYYNLLKNVNYRNEFKIIAFVDNNAKKWGDEIDGIKIISPCELSRLKFDYIDIWTVNYKDDIRRQIVDEIKIPIAKIKNMFEEYRQLVLEKYKNEKDSEIREFIKYFEKSEELTVYGFQPKDKHELAEVYYDEINDMNYIIFEGKKLYLARTFNNFYIKEGKKYIADIWQEQDANSPHLYEENEVKVDYGDVVIDAGVCEGNFALHNIEKAKKMYLIECDSNWIEALKATFAPYKDKVIFCNKILSDYDSENAITLNSLIDGSVNFIKMDIEGGEVQALKGADKVFANSTNIKCAICSYHKHGDEEMIKQMLNDYGVETSTSKGYMLFIYDDSVLKNPELRRGVVRGIKR